MRTSSIMRLQLHSVALLSTISLVLPALVRIRLDGNWKCQLNRLSGKGTEVRTKMCVHKLKITKPGGTCWWGWSGEWMLLLTIIVMDSDDESDGVDVQDQVEDFWRWFPAVCSVRLVHPILSAPRHHHLPPGEMLSYSVLLLLCKILWQCKSPCRIPCH